MGRGGGGERNTRIGDIFSPVRGPTATLMNDVPSAHPGNLTDHHQDRGNIEWAQEAEVPPDMDRLDRDGWGKNFAEDVRSTGDRSEGDRILPWHNVSQALYERSRIAPQKPRNKDTEEWDEIGHMVRVRIACRNVGVEASVSQTPCSETEAGQRFSSERPTSD